MPITQSHPTLHRRSGYGRTGRSIKTADFRTIAQRAARTAPDMPCVGTWREHLTFPIIRSLSRAVSRSRHSKPLVSCYCQPVVGHVKFRSAVNPREHLSHNHGRVCGEVKFFVAPSSILQKRERSHHARRIELFMSASWTLAAPSLGLRVPFRCHDGRCLRLVLRTAKTTMMYCNVTEVFLMTQPFLCRFLLARAARNNRLKHVITK